MTLSELGVMVLIESMQGVESFYCIRRLQETATIFEGKGHEENGQFFPPIEH